MTHVCIHAILKVKKLQREKMLSAIVDRNLEDYDIREVEMMIQMALLCTQASPEDRPTMSLVVRMLEGESLAGGRWEEWQHIEATSSRQDYYERRRGAAGPCYNQETMQLSGGR
ncbi:unnamed protein product [Cuscuta campestris]|uniref:Serine-threonine/tyrosine-protein kinase catalytic domain-containing protein n=1 Tax=Cuscuta campestris TaxID=132261 RepID=A0A484MGS1_9ASTE|nr:unnamed protein product [Cuscuta campestris]